MTKLMKASVGPVPCRECEKKAEKSSRWDSFKAKFRNLKRKKKKATKIKSSGVLKGQWRQEDLPKIIKKIVDHNPGITNIEIYATEIRWHCELNYYDLFPKKKMATTNPSKREDEP